MAIQYHLEKNIGEQSNMDTGITSFSQSTYELHQMMMWVCVVIGIAIYCAMIYAIIHHRNFNSAGAGEIHSSTKMEIFWTLISFLIFFTLAAPTIHDLVNMEGTTRSEHAVATQSTQLIILRKHFRNEYLFLVYASG